jgi:hypothetical protein
MQKNVLPGAISIGAGNWLSKFGALTSPSVSEKRVHRDWENSRRVDLSDTGLLAAPARPDGELIILAIFARIRKFPSAR